LSEAWAGFSVEFCGGTHISNTKDAQAFVLLEETAVAKGIRRISGITGPEAIVASEDAAVLQKDYDMLSRRVESLAAGTR
jgi:alanyl-tRNA synthetase